VAFWRRPLTVVGTALLVVILTVGGGVLVSNWAADDTPNTKKPTAGPTTGGVSSAVSTPPVTPPSDPPPECALPADECALIGRLPTDYADPTTCLRQDPPGPDQVAVVRCEVPTASVFGKNPGITIYATKFASQRAMDATVDGVATDYKLTFSAQGCFDLKPAGGRSTWRRRDRVDPLGQVLCYATDGSARIFWSYDGESILMAAVAEGPDVPALIQWWSNANLSAALR
jgi:hypothetical protein